MSFQKQIGEMKCFFIADFKKDKFIFSCPNNIKAITVSDVNSIFYSLRVSALKNKINKGKINSIDGFYFYFIFDMRIIVIVNTNLIYKDEILNEFVKKIVNLDTKADSDLSVSIKSIENFEMRLQEFEIRERIYRLYECYKLLDDGYDQKDFEKLDVLKYFTISKNKFCKIEYNREHSVKIFYLSN